MNVAGCTVFMRAMVPLVATMTVEKPGASSSTLARRAAPRAHTSCRALGTPLKWRLAAHQRRYGIDDLAGNGGAEFLHFGILLIF